VNTETPLHHEQKNRNNKYVTRGKTIQRLVKINESSLTKNLLARRTELTARVAQPHALCTIRMFHVHLLNMPHRGFDDIHHTVELAWRFDIHHREAKRIYDSRMHEPTHSFPLLPFAPRILSPHVLQLPSIDVFSNNRKVGEASPLKQTHLLLHPRQ